VGAIFRFMSFLLVSRSFEVETATVRATLAQGDLDFNAPRLL
jgi:hypothetical protein